MITSTAMNACDKLKSLRDVYETSKYVPIQDGGLRIILERMVDEIESINKLIEQHIANHDAGDGYMK